MVVLVSSCLLFPRLALPCLALSCLALPCLALSCLVLPCLALPCLVLPCLALTCLALFRPLLFSLIAAFSNRILVPLPISPPYPTLSPSSTQFNYTGDICISGSIDRTCKIWDVASGQCVQTLRGHSDEILDVCFNSTGNKLVTASADGTSRVYNTLTGACQAILIGHEGEISKVCFNPQGSKILTASSDHMARLWEVDTGDCLQVLEGHSDEIFSCAFNYEGDVSRQWIRPGWGGRNGMPFPSGCCPLECRGVPWSSLFCTTHFPRRTRQPNSPLSPLSLSRSPYTNASADHHYREQGQHVQDLEVLRCGDVAKHSSRSRYSIKVALGGVFCRLRIDCWFCWLDISRPRYSSAGNRQWRSGQQGAANRKPRARPVAAEQGPRGDARPPPSVRHGATIESRRE